MRPCIAFINMERQADRQTNRQTKSNIYLFIYLFIYFLVAQFRLFYGDLCLGILTVCSPADIMIHNKTSVT